MKYLDLTLRSPQENLACDEALLDLCEEGYPHEILRFWEPRDHFVVVGYSNKVRSEVNILSCRTDNVPIFRRCSGGGTILQGYGCLNYALILKIHQAPPLDGITEANAYVMNRNRAALQSILDHSVRVDGHTDLTLDNVKFSGNSQRRKRHHLLFHGTFLLNLDLALVERLLLMPSAQPPYRKSRRHAEFLRNLRVDPTRVKNALQKAWGATEPLKEIPTDCITRLAKEKYSRDEWNLKF